MSDERRFVSQVVAKAARKLKAQRATKQPAWFGLGMLGTIGWSVSVPTVAGALLGAWWDRHHPGQRSWTLPLLVAGLVLGCANAWHWISAEEKTMRDSEGPP
jgi:ATP synthase protein I